MIEVKPEENKEDDDLFTEPAEIAASQTQPQLGSRY